MTRPLPFEVIAFIVLHREEFKKFKELCSSYVTTRQLHKTLPGYTKLQMKYGFFTSDVLEYLDAQED